MKGYVFVGMVGRRLRMLVLMLLVGLPPYVMGYWNPWLRAPGRGIRARGVTA